MSETIDPIQWGRLLERLDSLRKEIRESHGRTVWRLDNMEQRVEVLENINSERKSPRKWTDWAVFGMLALNAVGWLFMFRALSFGD
jgi:hypothetical protein